MPRSLASSPVGSNPAFDVTPAKLITGLITEKGVCEASSSGLRKLFPKNNQKDDR